MEMTVMDWMVAGAGLAAGAVLGGMALFALLGAAVVACAVLLGGWKICVKWWAR